MKSEKLGIVSSVVASICCVGPLVAVSLGIGGVGLAAFFGKYHVVWLIAAAVLLSAGWLRYRVEAKTACTTGCDLAGGKRTRNVLLAATVIFASFLGMNVWTHWVRSSSAHSVAPKGQTAVIPVEGMVCFTCELALESNLKKLDGVLSVDASSTAKTVRVEFDPAATNLNEIKNKIIETGYKVSS